MKKQYRLLKSIPWLEKWTIFNYVSWACWDYIEDKYKTLNVNVENIDNNWFEEIKEDNVEKLIQAISKKYWWDDRKRWLQDDLKLFIKDNWKEEVKYQLTSWRYAMNDTEKDEIKKLLDNYIIIKV